MPLTPPLPAPLTLWLTDRTRSDTGLARCARKRYLDTMAGPTGYGYAAVRDSIPLTTGLAVHAGFEALCRVLQTEDRLPTSEETRAIALDAQAAYVAKVEAKGFLGILQGPLTDETIAEQRVLISGLLWAVRLRFLPWFHAHYRILSLEEERLHFLTCTCGAGPLAPAEHVQRGCQGIALMLRRDCLAERRMGHSLAYFEVKTTGWDSEAWAEQWEIKPQLGIGTLDVEQQFPGKEISEIYILSLSKGRRAKDRYEDDDPTVVQRKKQQTPLCYGYCRPANPPLMPDDWLPSYEWTTPDGQKKRKSKQHRRRGIWELDQSDWPTWLAYHAQEPLMPPEEFWVRNLPDSITDKVCSLLGPLNRQDAQLLSLRTAMIADEERWQTIAWELYEAQQAGATWAHPEFQRLLDRLVPCSWACRPFGKEHQCVHIPTCYHYQGWQDPIGSGQFKPRRPHHDPELQQAIARGLLVEQTEEEDDDVS